MLSFLYRRSSYRSGGRGVDPGSHDPDVKVSLYPAPLTRPLVRIRQARPSSKEQGWRDQPVPPPLEPLVGAQPCVLLPSPAPQPDLFDASDFSKEVEAFMRSIASLSRPSPTELIAKLAKEIGPKARWDLERVIQIVDDDPKIARSNRDYMKSLLVDDCLARALRGEDTQNPRRLRQLMSSLSTASCIRILTISMN